MSFSLDTIEAWRDKFEQLGHPKFGIERKGLVFNCYVLPQSNNPDLPDYAFRMTPDPETIRMSARPEDVSIFGVCDSIAAKVRDLVGGHEVDEFILIGENVKGRCRIASAIEIDRLARRDDLERPEKIDYLTMRRNFFKNLVAFATSRNHPPQTIEEYTRSLQLFEETLKNAK